MATHRPRVITLLTDFGVQDAYAGAMKGVIAGINPFANIIDICHTVPPQDIFSGAYLLYTAYKYFPRKTIHVAVVDPGVGSKRDIVCVETENFFFLAPDNGLLSFIIQDERPKSVHRVTNDKYFLPSLSSTFHGRDVFAPVAAHLSLGVKPQQLGIEINRLEQLEIPSPTYKNGRIEGQVISVDRFGNLISNITRLHIEQRLKCQIQDPGRGAGVRSKKQEVGSMKQEGRGKRQEVGGEKQEALKKASKERVFFRYDAMETTIGKKRIVGLSNTYTDVKPGEPLVLLGSSGFLEVSVNRGNAQKYFEADRNSKIRVEMGSY